MPAGTPDGHSALWYTLLGQNSAVPPPYTKPAGRCCQRPSFVTRPLGGERPRTLARAGDAAPDASQLAAARRRRSAGAVALQANAGHVGAASVGRRKAGMRRVVDGAGALEACQRGDRAQHRRTRLASLRSAHSAPEAVSKRATGATHGCTGSRSPTRCRRHHSCGAAAGCPSACSRPCRCPPRRPCWSAPSRTWPCRRCPVGSCRLWGQRYAQRIEHGRAVSRSIPFATALARVGLRTLALADGREPDALGRAGARGVAKVAGRTRALDGRAGLRRGPRHRRLANAVAGDRCRRPAQHAPAAHR